MTNMFQFYNQTIHPAAELHASTNCVFIFLAAIIHQKDRMEMIQSPRESLLLAEGFFPWYFCKKVNK